MKVRQDKKLEAVLKAGKEQLPPDQYETLFKLIREFMESGMTSRLNYELGRMMSLVQWELPEAESPEWNKALQECDFRFSGKELKRMYWNMGLMAPSLGKKQMAEDLYFMGQPQIKEIVDSMLSEEEIAEAWRKHKIRIQKENEQNG